MSLEMAAALNASVQLQLLPKSTIAVHVLVLQDDGGALPAAISCACNLFASAAKTPSRSMLRVATDVAVAVAVADASVGLLADGAALVAALTAFVGRDFAAEMQRHRAVLEAAPEQRGEGRPARAVGSHQSNAAGTGLMPLAPLGFCPQ